MAPQEPIDPTQVDVSLSLFDPNSVAAMTALTRQLQVMQDHMQQFATQNLENRTIAASRTFAQDPGTGVQEGGTSPLASHPQKVRDLLSRGAVPLGGSEEGAGSLPKTEEIDVESERRVAEAKKARETQQKKLEADAELADQAIRKRLGVMSREEVPGGGIRGKMGILSGEGIDRWNEIYASREKLQTQRRRGSDVQDKSIHAGYEGGPTGAAYTGGGGSDGGSGSMPPRGLDHGYPEESKEPGWLQGLKANPQQFEQAQEGITIPQFGEYTIQDKLRFGANWLTRTSTSAYDEAGVEGGTAGQKRGRMANLVNQAADNAGNIQLAAKELRKVQAFGGDLQERGRRLGYDRGSQANIPGTDIGIQVPDLGFDLFGLGTDASGESALNEGGRQRLTELRMSAKGGIDKGQAGEAVGALAGAGFSGGEATTLGMDYISPLMQQGQDPATVVEMFTKGIRNGNASMVEMADTLDNLGPAAKAARMGLDEYTKGLDAYAEQAQERGATYQQGLEQGRGVAGATGLSPQQAAQVTGSDLTQSMAFMNTGVLPSQQGLLSPQQSINATYDAIDLAKQFGQVHNVDSVDPETGDVIKGEDKMYAAAAQQAGMSVEDVKRLDKNRDLIQNKLTPSQTKVTEIQEGIGGITADIDKRREALGGERTKAQGMAGVAQGIGQWIGGGGESDEEKGERADLDNVEKELQRQVGTESQSWKDTERALAEMAVTAEEDPEGRKGWMAQIEETEDIKDPGERYAAAKGMMEERAQTLIGEEDPNQVYIKFVGEAAKYFEQVRKKNKRNAGARDKARAGGDPMSGTAVGSETAGVDINSLIESGKAANEGG